jgi:dTDP-4-dehydrorhamnose 3,5-epimerase
VKLVLYDSRPGSPTGGLVQELRMGPLRPMLVVVPRRVWHGVQNIGGGPCRILNLPDRAYEYESPDHWRLAHDTDQIPYLFSPPR